MITAVAAKPRPLPATLRLRLGHPVALLASIEISFIATFTQRFFNAR